MSCRPAPLLPCPCDPFVGTMRAELDMMAGKNRDLESRLMSTESRLSAERLQELDLDARNKALADELAAVERMSRTMQAEKDAALAAADREISDSKRELQVAVTKQNTMEATVTKMEKEKRELTHTLNETQRASSTAQRDVQDLSDLVGHLQEDKKRLTQRIDKLTANERALVLEIERLKRHGPNGKKGKMSEGEAYMMGIEQDRDYWKGEVELLNRMMSEGVSAGRTSSAGARKTENGAKQRTGSMKRSGSPTKMKRSKTAEKTKALEDEKNRLVRELETYKSMPSTAGPSQGRARSPARGSKSRGHTLAGGESSVVDLEVGKLKRERDDLRNLLNKLEIRVSEIQDNVRSITDERDHVSRLYQESRAELLRVRQDLVVSASAQSVIQQVERERDETISELRRTRAELDSLLARYQGVIQENSQRLAQFESELSSRDREMVETRASLSSVEDHLRRCQDALNDRDLEIQTMRRQIETTTAEMNAERRRADMVSRDKCRAQEDAGNLTRDNEALQRELQETTDERDDFRHRAQEYVAEVKRVEDVLAEKEREQAALLRQYEQLAHEADTLRGRMDDLQSTNQVLKGDLLERDVEVKRMRQDIDLLQRDLREKKTEIGSFEMQVASLTSAVSDLNDQLRCKHRDNERLMSDVAGLRDQCSRLESTKSSLERELDEKSADLEQNQSHGDDLEQEIDMLKDQLHSAEDNVRSLESSLQASREKEFQVEMDVQERTSELNMTKERLSSAEGTLDSAQREVDRLKIRNMELEHETDRLLRGLSNERFEKDRVLSELRIQSLTPYVPSALGQAAHCHSPHHRSTYREEPY